MAGKTARRQDTMSVLRTAAMEPGRDGREDLDAMAPPLTRIVPQWSPAVMAGKTCSLPPARSPADRRNGARP